MKKSKAQEEITNLMKSNSEYVVLAIDLKNGDAIFGSNKIKGEIAIEVLKMAIKKQEENSGALADADASTKPSYFG